MLFKADNLSLDCDLRNMDLPRIVSYGNGIVPTIDGISGSIIPSLGFVFTSGSSIQLILAIRSS